MTDKATLEEIEAEVLRDSPGIRLSIILEDHALRLLEICREQGARIKRLEKQIADDNELAKAYHGY